MNGRFWSTIYILCIESIQLHLSVYCGWRGESRNNNKYSKRCWHGWCFYSVGENSQLLWSRLLFLKSQDLCCWQLLWHALHLILLFPSLASSQKKCNLYLSIQILSGIFTARFFPSMTFLCLQVQHQLIQLGSVEPMSFFAFLFVKCKISYIQRGKNDRLLDVFSCITPTCLLAPFVHWMCYLLIFQLLSYNICLWVS